MPETVLEFKDVSFQYDEKKPMLSQFNLKLQEGEFVSIIGPSGSGKSTLFRLITGLENPDEGDILIHGKRTEKRLGQVGYMPQQDLLMPWRTILANASLPLEIQGMKKNEAHEKVRKLLDEFGLEGVEDRFPHELSGGMKQRVSFLRSILSGSSILLLDEPFSALDAITRLSMQEWLLDQWKKWKRTILFITHDVDEALFLSDRILTLSHKPYSSLHEVTVPIQRPRTLMDMNKQEIVLMKQNLLDQLRVSLV